MIRNIVVVATVFLAYSAFAAHDMVIESRPEGKNYSLYMEQAGPWIDSNVPPERSKSGASGLTPQGKCGTRKIELPDRSPGPGGSAKFIPRFKKETSSYIYVTWPSAANVQPAWCTVVHAAGQTQLPLRQRGTTPARPNSDKWLLIGQFRFKPGNDQYVELSINAGEAKKVEEGRRGQIYADAVRFTSEPIPDGVELTDDDLAP